ncbi:MAG: class I SAM-dependent DNA methyltransferase [Propionibacteriaceae bacterium]
MTNRFDDLAATWDDDPARAERARQVADAIAVRIPVQRNWSVVDLGSGTGLLGRMLAGRVGPIILVDTSEGMTAAANAKIAAAGLTGMTAVCLDITTDTPPGAPFDLATSLLVLHHVPDIHGFLEEVFALLQPGGYLAIADLASEDGSFHDDPTEDVQHHGFDPARLAGTARAVGFVEVEVVEIARLTKMRDGAPKTYGVNLLKGRVPVTVTTP